MYAILDRILRTLLWSHPRNLEEFFVFVFDTLFVIVQDAYFAPFGYWVEFEYSEWWVHKGSRFVKSEYEDFR